MTLCAKEEVTREDYYHAVTSLRPRFLRLLGDFKMASGEVLGRLPVDCQVRGVVTIIDSQCIDKSHLCLAYSFFYISATYMVHVLVLLECILLGASLEGEGGLGQAQYEQNHLFIRVFLLPINRVIAIGRWKVVSTHTTSSFTCQNGQTV